MGKKERIARIATESYFTPGLNIWNVYGFQAAATFECKISYARYAAGNRDGGQVAATFESIVSYTCHAILNNDFNNPWTITMPISV